MGFFDFLFSKSKPQPKVCKVEGVESIAVPLSSQFNLGLFRQAATAEYYRPSTKAMAIAAEKVAELIEDNFNTQNIRCMVSPREIVGDANPHALPIHFLFIQGGKPKVAVVIVTHNGFNTPDVLATKAFCEGNGIKYLRVYATGSYADWITGESSKWHGEKVEPATVAFCKERIVKRINNALRSR